MQGLNLNLNVVDLLLILLLLIGAWRGYRTGILRSLIRFAAVVLAFAGGILYGAPVAAWLEQQFRLHAHISEGTSTALSQMLVLPAGVPDPTALNPLSRVLEQLRQLKLPPAAVQFLEEKLHQLTEATLGGAVQSTATLLGDLLATMLVNGLVFLVILVVVNLAANLLIWLLKDGLGLINGSLDSLGGFCLGLLQMLFVLSLILAITVPFMAAQPENSYTALLQKSSVADAILHIFYSVVG